MRHPIYTGMLLATTGLAATTGDAIAVSVAVGCGVALPIQARLEEQFLLSRHGDEYRAYLERTGRFLPKSRARS
jgi:protein-S-isoprenylcysteine O-methyltransferase Ste14